MISLQKIAENFSCVASNYDKYADIQGSLSLELLETVRRQGLLPRRILDIGCGTGSLAFNLRSEFAQSEVFGLDISLGMVKLTKARGIRSLAADGASLPFDSESFDLVVSSCSYQWVSRLDAAFWEARRILKKDGSLIFNCFGSRTLNEVRSCFGIKNNFLPNEDMVYRSLKNAGFPEIHLETILENRYFNNLISLLEWLKNVGGNRIHSRQPFLTANRLKQANDFYDANYRINGKVYTTFEVIRVNTKKT